MLAMTLAINRQTVRDLRHPEPLVVHRNSFLVGGLHVVMIRSLRVKRNGEERSL